MAYALSPEAVTIANCLRLAAACITDAELLQSRGSRNAAYLAEQGLEQIIRAVATAEGIHIPRSDAHQLDKLTRLIPDANAEKPAVASLTWLEAYATTFRYTLPSGRIAPSPDGVKLGQALVDLRELTVRLAKHFQVDLGSDFRPAARTDPPR